MLLASVINWQPRHSQFGSLFGANGNFGNSSGATPSSTSEAFGAGPFGPVVGRREADRPEPVLGARRVAERLSAFSDGVFAVLITVLVLELRPPQTPTFAAALALWPTWLSYAVSYLFIAIVWVNHHHLMRFAGEKDAAADVVQLRASVLNFAASAFHGLDGGQRAGAATGRFLCGGLLPGERDLHVALIPELKVRHPAADRISPRLRRLIMRYPRAR